MPTKRKQSTITPFAKKMNDALVAAKAPPAKRKAISPPATANGTNKRRIVLDSENESGDDDTDKDFRPNSMPNHVLPLHRAAPLPFPPRHSQLTPAFAAAHDEDDDEALEYEEEDDTDVMAAESDKEVEMGEQVGIAFAAYAAAEAADAMPRTPAGVGGAPAGADAALPMGGIGVVPLAQALAQLTQCVPYPQTPHLSCTDITRSSLCCTQSPQRQHGCWTWPCVATACRARADRADRFASPGLARLELGPGAWAGPLWERAEEDPQEHDRAVHKKFGRELDGGCNFRRRQGGPRPGEDDCDHGAPHAPEASNHGDQA